MKHRKEEDDLYRKFASKRAEEDRKIQDEFQDEWERELQRLTHKFEKELATSRRSRDEANILPMRHEQQKEDLEKNMTLRRSKKKESITRKMLEHERYETAALVDRQSSEMLELISARRSEYMQSESIFLDDEFSEGAVPVEYPLNAPIPAPPAVSKFQIYTDPVEFEDVDRIAISVAQEDQKTFTDLVRQLVGRCTTDIEKARTIFRFGQNNRPTVTTMHSINVTCTCSNTHTHNLPIFFHFNLIVEAEQKNRKETCQQQSRQLIKWKMQLLCRCQAAVASCTSELS